MSFSEVEEIFHRALEQPSVEARTAFLNSTCAGKSVLLAQVEQLLAAHQAPVGFLDSSPDDPSVRDGPLESAGSRIGRYKLLQKIGEGGMGVVYMAEQEEPVRRKVALKIIKLGMDTRSVVARFEAERQALALMDHPNIARVLDGGATDTGRPYFVMELVQGVPITEFCDKNKLSAQARLRLFMQVCQAIQSAHQKGIIHRDIKPSNILVTVHNSEPMPRVIDFGIAKATDQKLTEKTLFTQHAAMIGTPAYMSPEQAEMSSLDVDTRSDIYSLGVLLYELLTGSTPFPEKRLRSAGYGKMQRIILHEEPDRPSMRLSTLDQQQKSFLAQSRGADLASLSHLLRGDLDWIVMKCLEKDRTRRYDTANGLAADIQRHLSNDAVVARPPSTTYKIQKAWRRNKLVYSAICAVAVALIAGAIVSYFQADRARKAEGLATSRLLEVQKERDGTEQERAKADQARQNAEQISQFLQKVFESPDPTRDGRQITVAELLDRSAKEAESELDLQPERRARIQSTLATTYSALGLPSAAIPLRERARAYWSEKLGPDSSEALSEARLLTRPLTQVGRLQEALRLAEDVLARYRHLYGAENTNSVRALYGYANVLEQLGRNKDALPLWEQSLDLSRKVFGPEHDETLRALNGLEVSYYYNGAREKARSVEEELVALALKVKGPEHPMTLSYLANRGVDYDNDRQYQKAIDLLESVLTTMRRVQGPEHAETLFAMQSLSSAYYGAGRREEALKMREEVLDLTRRKMGPEHPIMVHRTRSLAESYSAAGRTNEALQRFEEALALGLKVLGPAHQQTTIAADSLGSAYFQAGRFQEAAKVGEQALDAARQSFGSKNPRVIPWLQRLADYYRAAGQPDKSARILEEIIAFREDSKGEENPELIPTVQALAGLYAVQQKWAQAQQELSRLLQLKNVPDDAHLALLTLASLDAYLEDKPNHDALCKFILERFAATTNAPIADRMAKACLLLPIQGDHLTQAAALAERAVSLGANDPFLHWYLFASALSKYRSGDFQGAVSTGEKSLSALDGNNPYCAPSVKLILAMAHQKLGRPNEAKQALDNAIETINRKLPALDSLGPDDDWNNLLIAHSLLREARALIR